MHKRLDSANKPRQLMKLQEGGGCAPKDQGKNEQNYENKEKKFCDAGCGSSHSPKAKQCGDESDYQKNYSPT
jgi:hypothetical protein